MRTQHLLIFLLTFLLSSHTMANEVVHSCVYDITNQTPLANTTIQIKGKSQGTITDANGCFTLSISEFPATLIVSRLGYKTFTIELENHEIPVIYLVPKTFELETFEISSNNIHNVSGIDNLSVLDYKIFNSRIVLVGKVNHKNYMSLMHLDGTPIWSKPLKPFKIDQLYVDCTNSIYLFTKSKHAIELQLSDSELQFSPQISTASLLKKLDACKIKFKEHLIFQNTTYFGQHNELIAFNKDSPDGFLFETISYEKGVNFVQNISKYHDRSLHLLKMHALSGYRIITFDTPCTDVRYRMTMDFPPVTPFLFQHKNELITFDHANGWINTFDSTLSKINTVQIDYHLSNSWNREVLNDSKQLNVYSWDVEKGHSTFNKIDIEYGEVVKSYPVNKMKYIESPTIHDNVLYFIYKNKVKDGSRMSLFKIDLEKL